MALAVGCMLPQPLHAEESTEATVKTKEQLQEAIKNVNISTIRLGENISADVVIPENRSITLDLGGKTLTNETSHTIYNKGVLTIDGTAGTVDNVTHAKAALDNDGVAILNSGNFIRSKENGINSTTSGGNSFYTIRNHGDMTINSSVSVSQNGRYSSMIENGWQNGKENKTGTASLMEINGGTFSGGLNTIKNDDYGVLTIYDGNFANTTQAALLNWNEATVENGTFESTGPAVLNGGGNATMDKGTLNLKGGTFTGAAGQDAVAAMNGQASYLNGVDITGGAYSSDVSLMVAAGSSELVKASGDNRYQVGQYTSSTQGVTAATQLNNTNVFFESLNDAVKQKGVSNVNVVADATLTQPVPAGVNVTVMGNTTLTASGNLGNVSFQSGAKLVVPDGQTVTINGKQYSAGSYEAKGDGSLAKPETTPSAPADSSTGKTNPKTGVRA